jgi:hypothetical protein
MKNIEEGNTETRKLPIGKNVIVRTVTHYYTGFLAASVDGFLVMDNAAWIPETGRWADALRTGTLEEIEPYPGTAYIALGAVADLSDWNHDLPRAAK